MIVTCPNCSKTSESTDAQPGTSHTCPHCDFTFNINDEPPIDEKDLEKIKEAVGTNDSDVEEIDTDTELPPDIPEYLGTYKLERELAFGAVGKVFLAHHKSLKIPVAVKVLSRKISENLVTSQRFIREAQSAAQMNHINIVRVLDCGIEKGPENDIIFYVMEFVKGGSTGQEFRKGNIFDENEALAIGQSVCRALSEAEKHSIVHRDIKPDNIMIASEGIYKLADLGLAKSTDSPEQNTRSDLTGFQIGMGTPHYMSPEQAIDAKNVDIRADIYSLGVTLFQLATGALPYPGSDVGAVLRQHAVKTIPNPKEMNPKLSDGFCQMIMKCMAKMPEDRYSSPRELEMVMTELRAPFMTDNPIHQDTVTDMSGSLDSAFSGKGGLGNNGKPVSTIRYKVIIGLLSLLVIFLLVLLRFM